jgi:glucosamine--fructose-6-phosphate aminotransferase (isomerizing)
MVDHVVPLKAGTERSVLATKSFMAMVFRMLQIVDAVAPAEGQDASDNTYRAVAEIRSWMDRESLHDVARDIVVRDHVLTLGKGVGHKVALEAALKVKEGSYIHAEAFLTGELKHGPLALVTDGTPALLFATTPREIAAARIASHEITSRGGMTIGIGAFSDDDCSRVLYVPDLGMATSLVHIVIAQLVAYDAAIGRGVDPDYPRNLAKSVTVR